MKYPELWMKVFAASMSTSIIIVLSFFFRDYVNKKTGRRVKYHENPNISDVMIEFSLIFLSSVVSYTIVYMVLGLEL